MIITIKAKNGEDYYERVDVCETKTQNKTRATSIFFQHLHPTEDKKWFRWFLVEFVCTWTFEHDRWWIRTRSRVCFNITSVDRPPIDETTTQIICPLERKLAKQTALWKCLITTMSINHRCSALFLSEFSFVFNNKRQQIEAKSLRLLAIYLLVNDGGKRWIIENILRSCQ